MKGLAVFTDARAAPLTAGPDVRHGFGEAVQAFRTPPFRRLGGIADGFKDAFGRRSDENFSKDGVLVGVNGGLCHRLLLFKRMSIFARCETWGAKVPAAPP